MAPTACWPAAGTGSTSRSATGLTPSLPAASSPTWTSPCRQRSLTAEDDPWAAQSGHIPLAARRTATDTPGCTGGACNTPSLSPAPAAARPPTPPGLGPRTVFSPQRQGFFYARAPTRHSGPPHRPGGRNATGGCRSG
jgi:hypothetical protein